MNCTFFTECYSYFNVKLFLNIKKSKNVDLSKLLRKNSNVHIITAFTEFIYKSSDAVIRVKIFSANLYKSFQWEFALFPIQFLFGKRDKN